MATSSRTPIIDEFADKVIGTLHEARILQPSGSIIRSLDELGDCFDFGRGQPTTSDGVLTQEQELKLMSVRSQAGKELNAAFHRLDEVVESPPKEMTREQIKRLKHIQSFFSNENTKQIAAPNLRDSLIKLSAVSRKEHPSTSMDQLLNSSPDHNETPTIDPIIHYLARGGVENAEALQAVVDERVEARIAEERGKSPAKTRLVNEQREAMERWLPDKADNPVAYKLLVAAGEAMERGDQQKGVNILRLVVKDYRQSQEAACARSVIDRLAERDGGHAR